MTCLFDPDGVQVCIDGPVSIILYVVTSHRLNIYGNIKYFCESLRDFDLAEPCRAVPTDQTPNGDRIWHAWPSRPKAQGPGFSKTKAGARALIKPRPGPTTGSG